MNRRVSLVAGMLLAVPVVWAQWTVPCITDPNNPCFGKCGGEVNISGATLFEAFLRAPASTSDYENYDCDFLCIDVGCTGNPANFVVVPYTYKDLLAFSFPPDCLCTGGYPSGLTDQLAPWPPTGASNWWLVNYRGVGSGNGLAEFVRTNIESGWFPTSSPDIGLVNRYDYMASGGGVNPYPPTEPTQLAVMDVPTTWFTTVSGSADWQRRPTQDGYGLCPLTAYKGSSTNNKLKSLAHPSASDPNSPYYGATLNTNFSNPDERTVYDTQVAWVPIGFIANPGAGVPGCDPQAGRVRASDLIALFRTGRMPNGENLLACTRDSGSGTRNGSMNTLCVDPSWGVGDNRDLKTGENDTTYDKVGPNFTYTNRGGSSRMEASVQNARLAVGYTGVAGSSRAIVDAQGGNYEMLQVMFDQRCGACCFDGGTCRSLPMHECDAQGGTYMGYFTKCSEVGCPDTRPTPLGGCELTGGTCVVVSAAACQAQSGLYYGDNTTCYGKVSKYNVLYNGPTNPQAWPIGGNETFASLGNPAWDASVAGGMPESAAKDYLNNIRLSVADFVDAPADPNLAGTPGQYLAITFSLAGALSWVPDALCPCTFIPNPDLNPNLQTWTYQYNIGLDGAPAWGSVQNKTPTREVITSSSTPWPAVNYAAEWPYPATGLYSDGTTGNTWKDCYGNNWNNSRINSRNRLAGDFNGDGVRCIDDIPAMMAAFYDRFVLANPAFPTWNAQYGGSATPGNPVVFDILGDFNADGNFDARDVRYFADGLAIDPVTGKLNRFAGFQAIDNAWATLTGGADNNFFNTTVVACSGATIAYVPGYSAFDVAGNTPWAGAEPHGYNGVVNSADLTYVRQNRGIFPAFRIDLSCDMNGDLVVDTADETVLTNVIGTGCTVPPVPTGACCVGGCDGMLHCEVMTEVDCYVANNYRTGHYKGNGTDCSDPGICVQNSYCLGDVNCDCSVTFDDIRPFVKVLTGQPTGLDCPTSNADVDEDGDVDFDDIKPFVRRIGTVCECDGCCGGCR